MTFGSWIIMVIEVQTITHTDTQTEEIEHSLSISFRHFQTRLRKKKLLPKLAF